MTRTLTFRDKLIRVRAIQAYKEQQDLNAERARERKERETQQLSRWLNRHLETTPEELEAAGIKARLRNNGLQIIGECDICHDRVWSRDIYTLADLGEMLDNFCPDYESHYCQIDCVSVADDITDRLAAVLRELMGV